MTLHVFSDTSNTLALAAAQEKKKADEEAKKAAKKEEDDKKAALKKEEEAKKAALKEEEKKAAAVKEEEAKKALAAANPPAEEVVGETPATEYVFSLSFGWGCADAEVDFLVFLTDCCRTIVAPATEDTPAVTAPIEDASAAAEATTPATTETAAAVTDKPATPKAARRLSTRITGLFKGKEAKSVPASPATDKVAEEAPKVRRPAHCFYSDVD